MTFDEYIIATRMTDASGLERFEDQSKPENILKTVIHYLLGMTDEFLYELEDAIKKTNKYGDKRYLIDESGDSLWYIARYCDMYNISEEIIKANKFTSSLEKSFGLLLGIHKKNIMYGKELNSQTQIDNISNIINSFWKLFKKHNISPSLVYESNIKKLKARYGDSFDASKAINKNATKELTEVYGKEIKKN